jgi:hypothetical protein
LQNAGTPAYEDRLYDSSVFLDRRDACFNSTFSTVLDLIGTDLVWEEPKEEEKPAEKVEVIN